MMKIIAGIITTLVISNAQAFTNVALIDTGVDVSKIDTSKLCKGGHYDFLAGKEQIGPDKIGHGTSMFNTIVKYAKDADFCITVLKSIEPGTSVDLDRTLARSILYAITIKAKVINYSISGDNYMNFERMALKVASSSRIFIFVAAGNDGKDLDDECFIFPACYQNIQNLIIVGSKNQSSNKGDVVKIRSEVWCDNKMCGTSTATAATVGKFLKHAKDNN